METKNFTQKLIEKIDFKSSNNFDMSNLLRPNEDVIISQQLSLNFDSTTSTSINDYLDSVNENEMDFYRAFENCIPLTDSMNPHIKPYPLRKFYVDKTKEGQEYKHFKKLLDLLETEEDDGKGKIKLISRCQKRGGILHIGEKGSGKTLTQNVWLHDNFDVFEKNNILWIRLDVTKLINIWENSPDRNPNLTSTEDYLIGQLVYVFCKHFNNKFPNHSDLINRIYNDLLKSPANNIPESQTYSKAQSEFANSNDELLYFHANKKGIQTISDYLIDFERQIAMYEGTYAGVDERKELNRRMKPIKSFIVDKVLIDSQKFSSDRYKGSKTEWMAIGSKLREFILNSNYKILYIIDGMENINQLHVEHKNYLKAVIKNLYNFPLKIHGSYENELIIMALRDTTYETLKRVMKEEMYDDYKQFRNIDSFYKIQQETNNIHNLILNKRIEIFLKESTEKCFMKEVLKVIKDSEFSLENNNWNSNLRCFLHNHLSLAKLITFRYYFAGQPKDFSIKDQISTFEKINYLLNGKLFLNEQTDILRTNKGHNLFNIFGYVNKGTNKPSYFIYTRILQIIKAKPDITEQKLLNFLNTFGYLTDDIECCLDRLIRSGLINLSYSPNVVDKIKYKITPKGLFAINIFYNDIHYLYYTSLNTLLPEYIIDKLKISPNNFHFVNIKRFYPPHCIISGLVFLQFLITFNENSIASKNKSNSNTELKMFKLPIDIEKLKESVEKMVNLCLRDEDYKKCLLDYIN